VIFTPKDSFDALVDHLRTNWVLSMIQTWLEILMLLGNNEHGFIVLYFFVLIGLDNRILNISPNIRSIIPIEIDNLFLPIALVWRITLISNRI
jgi:hypothetical protein